VSGGPVKEKVNWSRWFHKVSHLSIRNQTATIQRFEDGSCTLWIYHKNDKKLWSEYPTFLFKTVAGATSEAEKRLGVVGIGPQEP
jgi:hypothetical protein